jgi:tyrosyl-tRNA synthetase
MILSSPTHDRRGVPGSGRNEAPIITDPERVHEVLTRRVAEVIDCDDLERRMRSGKRLRIKLGIDPTASRIHIGRAIQLWKLYEFQELGHQVIIVIGDFTGLIGDPSDKDEVRRMLTQEQIAANMADYVRQIGRVLDLERTEFTYNSTWLSPLTFADVVRLASSFTVQRMLERDRFQKRLAENKPLGLHELLYPLMQGYDSIALHADMELGGTDQTFNLLAGRVLQKDFGQEPQDIMTTEMLPGLDGRKMSSSWGNVITIEDAPEDMFGKLMSMTDEMVPVYFRLCTNVPEAEIDALAGQVADGRLHPMDFKKRMAGEIVRLYHGAEAAERAAQAFATVVQRKEIPADVPEVRLPPAPEGGWTGVDLLIAVHLASSRGEARRLIEQGGVTLDGVTISDPFTRLEVRTGMILRRGKRQFVRVAAE